MRLALLCLAFVATAQQPETLSLLGKPLFAPHVRGEEQRKLETTIAEARGTLARDQANIDAWLSLARATTELGHPGEAAEIYTRAREAHVDDPRLYRERGRDYIAIRKFAAALKDFRKAAETVPDAHCDEGFALYLLDQFAEAADALRSCDAGDFSTWKTLAAQRAGRDVPDAKGTISVSGGSSHDLHEQYVTAVDTLLRGDKQKATDLLKTIVEKNQSEWMKDVYIAAEADYARLPRKNPKAKKKK